MAFSSDKMRQAAGAGDGYTIDNSCRFNDNDSAYLSRTPSSAGDRQKWTWSGWFKLGDMSSVAKLISSTNENILQIRTTANDQLEFYEGASYTYRLVSDQVFRDVSNWYHIILAVDTAQSTASNRVKMYVNGNQITSFSVSNYPSRYHETAINNNTLQELGHNYSGYLDGYLAEVHFIDGQALDHTSFGETDETYGHWKPKEVTGMTYGTNGFYLPFDNERTKHSLTANGNVNHSTAQSKVGGSSIYFDGSGDYLSTSDHIDWARGTGTGDFTIEYWLRPSNTSEDQHMGQEANSSNYWRINASSSRFEIQFETGGSSHANFTTGGHGVSANTWVHVAVVLSGSTITCYLDGVSRGSDTWSGGTMDTAATMMIGGYRTGSGYDELFNGYMDEIRISNTARYTSGFTPSTTAFTDDSNTLLLIHSDESNGSTTFTDSSGVEGGFGNDQSGQANHWTANNLATTDQMIDTPTNNFCTLNAVNKEANQVLLQGNLETNATSNAECVRGTQGVESGKWYWEGYIKRISADMAYPGFGYMSSDEPINHWANASGDGVVLSTKNARLYYNGGSYTDLTSFTFTTGDICQIAVDFDSGKIWFGKNNTWYNSGNPAAGTNATSTALTTDVSILPTLVDGDGTGGGGTAVSQTVVNFGQDSSFAGNKTAQGNADDNDYGDFYYSPPSGYLALCTANLDDPAAGLWSGGDNVNFNTVTYTGNGGTQSITGVGFQPDWTWIKKRDTGASHALYDAIRGTINRLMSDLAGAEDPADSNSLTAFNSDGYALGNQSHVNGSGGSYVSWNWKANGSGSSNTDGSITSTVSANTTAGFSIVSYTGSTSESVGHGLDQAPEMIIVKDRDVSSNWAVYHQDVQDNTTNGFLEINTTSAIQSGSNPRFLSGTASTSQPTSTVFYVNNYSGSSTNTISNDYIAYCFHSVDGYSKVGSYTGNGSSDGTFVYTGFRPAYVMIKRTNSAEHWWIADRVREPTNVSEKALRPSTSAGESDNSGYAIDLLSNGFKSRSTAGQANASNGNYIYLAFAEHPFKYSNAR